MRHLSDDCSKFARGGYADRNLPMDMVRLCNVLLAHFPNDVAETKASDLVQRLQPWKELWPELASVVVYYITQKGWTWKGSNTRIIAERGFSIPLLTPEDILAEDRSLAEDGLRRIASLEQELHRLNHKFPDELIEALGRFVPAERRHMFPVLSRIPDKKLDIGLESGENVDASGSEGESSNESDSDDSNESDDDSDEGSDDSSSEELGHDNFEASSNIGELDVASETNDSQQIGNPATKKDIARTMHPRRMPDPADRDKAAGLAEQSSEKSHNLGEERSGESQQGIEPTSLGSVLTSLPSRPSPQFAAVQRDSKQASSFKDDEPKDTTAAEILRIALPFYSGNDLDGSAGGSDSDVGVDQAAPSSNNTTGVLSKGASNLKFLL
jgi:hypothetical protein